MQGSLPGSAARAVSPCRLPVRSAHEVMPSRQHNARRVSSQECFIPPKPIARDTRSQQGNGLPASWTGQPGKVESHESAGEFSRLDPGSLARVTAGGGRQGILVPRPSGHLARSLHIPPEVNCPTAKSPRHRVLWASMPAKCASHLERPRTEVLPAPVKLGSTRVLTQHAGGSGQVL